LKGGCVRDKDYDEVRKEPLRDTYRVVYAIGMAKVPGTCTFLSKASSSPCFTQEMFNLDSKTPIQSRDGIPMMFRSNPKIWVYPGSNEGTGSPKFVQGRETQLLTILAKTKLWAARTLHGKVQREEENAKHALTSSMILVVKC
jgi:hypothetical protein